MTRRMTTLTLEQRAGARAKVREVIQCRLTGATGPMATTMDANDFADQIIDAVLSLTERVMPLTANKNGTPGPWSAAAVREGTVVYIQSGQAARIADVHSFSHGFGPSRMERDANARLIAAAPDLLAALQAIMGASGDPAREEAEAKALSAQARAAIEKAIAPTFTYSHKEGLA